MASRTYLTYRNGRPYFKRVVPPELRQAIGCTAVWKRLRPDAYCSAEALARAEASAMDTRMAQARREFALRERVDSLHAHHVPRICARFDAISLATDVEERAAMAHADRAAHRSPMTDAQAQARDELAYLDTSTVEETAAELLALEGLTMPSDHRAWDQLLLVLLTQLRASRQGTCIVDAQRV